MGARTPILLAAIAAALLSLPAGAADIKPRHGMAMHGEPKYGPDFKHFEYVNPDAPKGGEMRFGAIGTFDNLNPFILKGVIAAGGGLQFDTLMANSEDEAFTEYGLLAESIEVPEDRSWVTFNLRPEARFHDGSKVTASDVVWTFETLKTKGHPQYRLYYNDVAKVEELSPSKVKFTFNPGDNRELPLILGQLPVLPKAYWANRDFTATTLEPPLGSGPYKVARVDVGRSITYERVDNYWGKDLPVMRGKNNFGSIRYEYFRDASIAVEGLKAGTYDMRMENSAKDWATAYDSPAIGQGLLIKEEIPNQLPNGMQGFVYNLRKPLFQDARVREALAYMFDFEWSNKALFYGQYTRTRSYFSNSELGASGLPSPEELKILEPLRAQLPPQVFTTEYNPPTSDGTGNMRPQIRNALRLLKEAGWDVKDGKLLNKQGQQFEFEILLNQPNWERIALPFAQNLKSIGVNARVRTVDTAQYKNREDHFDYDMLVDVFGQSLSPGNEQRDMWTTRSADEPGARNSIGIKNPAIDKLVELVIAAPDREQLIIRTRALDRALQWGHYVIPHWHNRVFRVVRWSFVQRPATPPKYGLGQMAWWIDQAKQGEVRRQAAPKSTQ